LANSLGIMQGRLSPPVNGKIQAFPWETWEEEFRLAAEVGLTAIDWIVESERLEENPLLTPAGRRRAKELVTNTGVAIGAVCADYFMECPFIRCTPEEQRERLRVLDGLLEDMNAMGIEYLEIPCVDNSSIDTQEELDQLVDVFAAKLNRAHELGVTIAFETSLSAETFCSLLDRLGHVAARANYDTGNSASLGYNPREELAAYGERVVTLHVKDRVLGGTTVPLGQGDTDFAASFSMLHQQGFCGPIFLQVARQGDEMTAVLDNLAFVGKLMGDWA
jgi:L-ribulose-5-phosphate 3-epimerase